MDWEEKNWFSHTHKGKKHTKKEKVVSHDVAGSLQCLLSFTTMTNMHWKLLRFLQELEEWNITRAPPKCLGLAQDKMIE